MTRIEPKIPVNIPMPSMEVCLGVAREFNRGNLAGAAKLAAESYQIKPAKVVIDDSKLAEYNVTRQKNASRNAIAVHYPLLNNESAVVLSSNPTLHTFLHEFAHSLMWQNKMSLDEEAVCDQFADNFVQQAQKQEAIDAHLEQSKRLWQEGDLVGGIREMIEAVLVPMKFELDSLESQVKELHAL